MIKLKFKSLNRANCVCLARQGRLLEHYDKRLKPKLNTVPGSLLFPNYIQIKLRTSDKEPIIMGMESRRSFTYVSNMFIKINDKSCSRYVLEEDF